MFTKTEKNFLAMLQEKGILFHYINPACGFCNTIAEDIEQLIDNPDKYCAFELGVTEELYRQYVEARKEQFLCQAITKKGKRCLNMAWNFPDDIRYYNPSIHNYCQVHNK